MYGWKKKATQASSYNKLELVFRNQKNGATRSVFFDIESHDLAQRWGEMLRENLKEKTPLQKSGMLLGWPGTSRDTRFLCQELN